MRDLHSGSSGHCRCCYGHDNFVVAAAAVAAVLLAGEQVFVVWEEASGERSTSSAPQR